MIALPDGGKNLTICTIVWTQYGIVWTDRIGKTKLVTANRSRVSRGVARGGQGGQRHPQYPLRKNYKAIKATYFIYNIPIAHRWRFGVAVTCWS